MGRSGRDSGNEVMALTLPRRLAQAPGRKGPDPAEAHSAGCVGSLESNPQEWLYPTRTTTRKSASQGPSRRSSSGFWKWTRRRWKTKWSRTWTPKRSPHDPIVDPGCNTQSQVKEGFQSRDTVRLLCVFLSPQRRCGGPDRRGGCGSLLSSWRSTCGVVAPEPSGPGCAR